MHSQNPVLTYYLSNSVLPQTSSTLTSSSEKAVEEKHPIARLAFVVAFAVSGYAYVQVENLSEFFLVPATLVHHQIHRYPRQLTPWRNIRGRPVQLHLGEVLALPTRYCLPCTRRWLGVLGLTVSANSSYTRHDSHDIRASNLKRI